MSKPDAALEDAAARIRDERDEIHRAYHEALAALEEALRLLGTTPYAGPVHAPQPEGRRHWRRRLSAFAWRSVPILRQQRAFNTALVDTLTRFVGQIAPYVNMRDGELADALRRLADDSADARSKLANDFADVLRRLANDSTDALRRLADDSANARNKLANDCSKLASDAADARSRLAGELSATLWSVADDMKRRWESMAARERRNEARVDEIRQAATAWRQVTASLRRELERLSAQPAATVAAQTPSTDAADPGTQLASATDSAKYVGFEDRFRGAAVEIRARCAYYARHFDAASDVLDVGCGRGEFLDVLRGRAITATGVDINPEMVAQCRARGLEVVERDLLAHLASLPDASLGGLFSAQVVEHLEPAYLLKFIDTAFLKLRPGARIVLETINVASWIAFFQSYIRDITHVRPLHPETLDYLVTAGGFQKVEVVYRSPFPTEHRLAKAPGPEAGTGEEDARLGRVTAVFNRNVEQLNRLLYADQDYAVIAERG